MSSALRSISMFLPLAVTGAVTAQSTWIEIPTSSPSGLLAYDESRQRVLQLTQGPRGSTETWLWDDRSWTRMYLSYPPPRNGAAVAWSPFYGTVITVGGADSAGVSDEVYLWRGDHWSAPQSGPSARADHAMATDLANGKIVLFGGWDGSQELADTWEHTSAGWRRVAAASGPPARRNAMMSVDPVSGEMLLVGGWSRNRPQFVSDTWSWNGTRWRQLPVASPTGTTYGQSMATDTRRRRVVLLSLGGETWEWDGTQWSQRQTAGSGPSGTAVYDRRRGSVLASGTDGVSFDARTWEWNGTTWTPLPGGDAPGAGSVTMAEDALRGTVVALFTQPLQLPTSTTWTFDGRTWTRRGGAAPQYAHGVVFGDPLHGAAMYHVTVVPGVTTTVETQVWNGSTWSSVAVPGPSVMTQPVAAYDEARQQALLFGENSTTGGSETWLWNGSQWQQRNVPGPPPALYYAPYQAAYDRNRQRIVLFGGAASGSPDTWEWDGMAWTAVVPTNVPPDRSFAMAFAPDVGRVILHGDSAQQTTWIWNGTTWSPLATIGTAPAVGNRAAVTHTASGHVVFVDPSNATPRATWLLGRGPAAATNQRTLSCPALAAISLWPFGKPVLGNASFALDALTRPQSPIVVLLGTAGTASFGGCVIGVDPGTALVLPARSDAFGHASLPLPIPSWPSLRGVVLSAQAAGLSSSPTGVDLSKTWSLQIGE